MKLNNALLIQPISAAKMTTGLNPDRVLSAYFGNMTEWVESPTNDVAIIFTSGLYQNNDSDSPRRQRLSLLQREGEWRNRFEKIFRKNSSEKINGFPLIREGFHLAGWDDNIVENWNEFHDNLNKLECAYQKDTSFKSLIDDEIKKIGRLPTEANRAFIFEETAVTALWLNGSLPNSKGLRTQNRPDSLYLVYPSAAPIFLLEGLKILLKDKRGLLPLTWMDTSERFTIPSSYHFGRDVPTLRKS